MRRGETGPSPKLCRRTRRCRQGDGARSGPSALCAGRVLARAAEGVLTAARANTMSLTQPKSWGVSGFMSPSGPSRTHPSNSSGLRHIVFARERSPRSVEGRSPRRARIAGRRRRCGWLSGRPGRPIGVPESGLHLVAYAKVNRTLGAKASPSPTSHRPRSNPPLMAARWPTACALSLPRRSGRPTRDSSPPATAWPARSC